MLSQNLREILAQSKQYNIKIGKAVAFHEAMQNI